MIGWKHGEFSWRDNLKPQSNKNTGKQHFLKPRSCRICGKPAEIGDMCKSCRDFIKQKKREER